jgi:hypothetical protein
MAARLAPAAGERRNMTVIEFKLPEPKRAPASPQPPKKISRADLITLLDQHPPSGAAFKRMKACECGRCDGIVRRGLFDLFATDFEVFQRALESGQSRKESLLVLRDRLLRLPETIALLANTEISRRSILVGVNQRAAEAAWRVCFPPPELVRPRCGMFASAIARAR